MRGNSEAVERDRTVLPRHDGWIETVGRVVIPRIAPGTFQRGQGRHPRKDIEFAARVRNVGMEAMVRGLVDKAIMQRAAQVVSGATGERDSC